MTYFLTPDQAAELMVNGIIAWAGPRFDIVCEPGAGGRLLVAVGDGDADRAFARAAELRARLKSAIARTLRRFGEQTPEQQENSRAA